jgi:hypothetical protein
MLILGMGNEDMERGEILTSISSSHLEYHMRLV